ncbi:MAG: hypothetical protein PHQ23_05745 [Candidatus Wallbacteria bacterium]|nr:hypothetical protein [Candidatus Wallbacteria bacterium]
MKRCAMMIILILSATGVLHAIDLDAEMVSMEFKDADIQTVLQIFVREKGLNIVAGSDVTGRVTVSLNNVSLKKALEVILEVNGFDYLVEGNIVKVFRRGSEPVRNIVLQLDRLDAEQAAILVKPLLSNEGKLNTDPSTNSLVVIDNQASLDNVTRLIRLLEERSSGKPAGKSTGFGRRLQVFTLKKGDSGSVGTLIKPLLSEKGEIINDMKSNSLIVTDLEQNLSVIDEAIAFLDRKPRQVMIEAKIMEVSLRRNDNMGLDWFWHNLAKGVYDASGVAQDLSSLTVKMPSEVAQMATGGILRFGTLDSQKLTLAIKALTERSESKLLSAPKIAALNNTPAEIEINDRWPKKQISQTGTAGGEARDTTTFEFVDIPVKLSVVPKIGEDDYIDMNLTLQVDNVVEIVDTATNTPRISQRKSNTTLRVKNSETIVIGGLIKNDVIKRLEKVPVLGDLPLIRAAFRTHRTDLMKSELVIFITPYIMEEHSGDKRLVDVLKKRDQVKPIDPDLAVEIVSPKAEEQKPVMKSMRSEETQRLLEELKSEIGL